MVLRRMRNGAAEDSWASSTCSVSPAGSGASSHLSSQPSHHSVPTSPKPSLPTPLPRASHEHTETHPPPTSSFPAAGLSAEVAFAGAVNPRAQNTRSHQGKS